MFEYLFELWWRCKSDLLNWIAPHQLHLPTRRRSIILITYFADSLASDQLAQSAEKERLFLIIRQRDCIVSKYHGNAGMGSALAHDLKRVWSYGPKYNLLLILSKPPRRKVLAMGKEKGNKGWKEPIKPGYFLWKKNKQSLT